VWTEGGVRTGRGRSGRVAYPAARAAAASSSGRAPENPLRLASREGEGGRRGEVGEGAPELVPGERRAP